MLILAFFSGPTVRNDRLLLCREKPFSFQRNLMLWVWNIYVFIVWIKALNATVSSLCQVFVESWVPRLTLCREWSPTSFKVYEKETKDEIWYTAMLIKPRRAFKGEFVRLCTIFQTELLSLKPTAPLLCIELTCVAVTEMQIKANMED